MVSPVKLLNRQPQKQVNIPLWGPLRGGGCKINFVGLDIFTQKKYPMMYNSGDTVDVPVVTKNEYQIMVINHENPPYLSLMSNSGILREDIRLPETQLGQEIKKCFQDRKIIMITVLESMGKEMIISYRIDK